MHIRLSTNSREARKYVNTLGDIDCGYAYSYGFGEEEELNKKNSWGVKIFYGIDKILSQSNALPNQDKEIINYITDTANYLNYAFSQEDPDYIKNMSIVMNVNSKFNTVMQKSLGLIKEFAPSYASKLATGIDQFAGNINPQTKKMIIGASLFEENDDAHPFVPYLIQKLGTEKAVEFVVFHEASHTFEKTNIQKNGIKWDDRISDTLLLAHELDYVSKENIHKNIGSSLNELISSKFPGKFPYINMDFLSEIKTLEAEIYADAGAILLVRNTEIEKGTYSKENLNELIDTVIKGRQKEQTKGTLNKPIKESVSVFNHFTVLGLEHLKETLNNVPEISLSQKDIYQYASEASKVGLARTILASSLANSENAEQLKMLFNLEYHPADKFIGLPDNIDNSKTQEGMSKLIDLAGPQWFNDFTDRIDKMNELDDKGKLDHKVIITNKSRNIWLAATNKNQFESNIKEHINLLKRLDNVTHGNDIPSYPSIYVDTPPNFTLNEIPPISFVKEKNEVLNAVKILRDKDALELSSFKVFTKKKI